MSPQTGRAKRYAQCHFVDMSAHKSVMLARACCMLGSLAEPTSIHVSIKMLKNRW